MEINKSKVLVVEDAEIAQKFATMTLHDLGCEVHVAETGFEAIKMANQNIYDIILMDLGLPDIDGLKVTETIRKIEGNNRNTPVVALTAHSENKDGINNKQNCLKVGMNDYIEKPLTREIAEKMLEKFLQKLA